MNQNNEKNSGDLNSISNNLKPQNQNNTLPENYGRERVREYTKPADNVNTKGTKNEIISETEKSTPNESNDVKKLDINFGKEKEHHNCLLGRICDNHYQIDDGIAKELIILEKIVIGKNGNDYKAYALCGTVRFDFVITVKDIIEEGKPIIKVAYLKIVESYKKGPESEKKFVSTIIAKFQDIFTNDYLFKVKKAFHLHSKDENEGKVFENNESIAFLTLGAYYRISVIETYTKEKKDPDLKHIQELLKILNTSAKGRDVAAKFEKQTNFKTHAAGKEFSFPELRATLYKIIDAAIAEKSLDEPTASQIKEARKKFSAENKVENKKDKAPASSPAKSVGKPASKAPSSGGKSSSGKSGGGGGGKPKKDGGKDDKKSDKKPLIDASDFLSPSSAGKPNEVTGKSAGFSSGTQTKEVPGSADLLNLLDVNPDLMINLYGKSETKGSSSQNKLLEQELSK